MEKIIETLMHQNLMVINKGTDEHPDYVVGGTDDLKRELVKLFAIPDVRRAAFNEAYDKFVECEDDNAYTKWLNKVCG